MDNERFGAFLAQLRKELGLTQKELAGKLNVTDKAVSKWETGKGFPDVKLLEPLARALGVSLVELMQGRRQEADTLTVAEADAAVFQAMDRSERATARRYLWLFRWFLTAACGLCLLWLVPQVLGSVLVWRSTRGWISPGEAGAVGIIGGADGPTAIITASHTLSSLGSFLEIFVPVLLVIVCAVLAVKVWRLEKKLK